MNTKLALGVVLVVLVVIMATPVFILSSIETVTLTPTVIPTLNMPTRIIPTPTQLVIQPTETPTLTPTYTASPIPTPTYAVTKQIVEVTTNVKDGNLNVRIGPGIKFPIIDVLQEGTEIRVLICLNGWAFIEYDDSNGWANSEFLSEACGSSNTSD